MSKTFVVGIDGSEGCIRAANYAAERAKISGTKIKIIHVLEWSPYSFLTKEEVEERSLRRKEELTRAKTSILDPIVSKLKDSGVDVEAEVRYGNVLDVIMEYAKEQNAGQIIIGRHGGGRLANRVFGSVPGNLVQVSVIPVTVVP